MVLAPVGTREVRGQTVLVVRKARAPRRCNASVGVGWDGECGRLIPTGQAYCESTAPPWHEHNPAPGRWTHHALCDLHPVWWPNVR